MRLQPEQARLFPVFSTLSGGRSVVASLALPAGSRRALSFVAYTHKHVVVPPRPVACSHRVITVGTAPRVSCCGARTGIGVVLHTQTPARHATAHCQWVRCRCRVVRVCPACLTLVLACPSSGPRGLTPLSSSWCQPPCKGVGGWLCVLRGLSARVNTRVVRCTLPDRCVVVGGCNRTYVVATGVTTRQETHA